MSDSLLPHGLSNPWNSGQNTGVGCHFLHQGILPTQGSNPGFPDCRQILYQLSHQGSPIFIYILGCTEAALSFSCRIRTLSSSMWDLIPLDQRLNPRPLYWEHGALVTGPPGKSLSVQSLLHSRHLQPSALTPLIFMEMLCLRDLELLSQTATFYPSPLSPAPLVLGLI